MKQWQLTEYFSANRKKEKNEKIVRKASIHMSGWMYMNNLSNSLSNS
jgi:hypothetical protein